MKPISLISLNVARLATVLAIATLVNGCSWMDRKLGLDNNPSPSPTISPSPSPTNTNNTVVSEDGDLEEFIRSQGCLPPNESEYIYQNYRIGWTTRGSRFEGILHMEGDVGKMKIDFFNENINSTDSVEQTMVLANCTQGLILFGFNPVVPGTDTKHSYYVADNLIIRRETDGSVTVINIDNQGVTAPVEIEQISNSSN